MASPSCLACKANRRELELSSWPPLVETEHWIVWHADRTSIAGWLVVSAARHRRALHDLSLAEFTELGELLSRLTAALHAVLGSAKEYVAMFAEAPGFEHVHFHVVPRSAEWPQQLTGPEVFRALGPDVREPASDTEVRQVLEELRSALGTQSGSTGPRSEQSVLSPERVPAGLAEARVDPERIADPVADKPLIDIQLSVLDVEPEEHYVPPTKSFGYRFGLAEVSPRDCAVVLLGGEGAQPKATSPGPTLPKVDAPFRFEVELRTCPQLII
jgi:diadenosine tetraphosphate (Ap4A) HIT family hydrolase